MIKIPFHISFMHIKTLERIIRRVFDVACQLGIMRKAACNRFHELGWDLILFVRLCGHILSWVCSPVTLRLSATAIRTPGCLLLSPTKTMGFQQPDCRNGEYLRDGEYTEAPTEANCLRYRLQSCNERSGK